MGYTTTKSWVSVLLLSPLSGLDAKKQLATWITWITVQWFTEAGGETKRHTYTLVGTHSYTGYTGYNHVTTEYMQLEHLCCLISTISRPPTITWTLSIFSRFFFRLFALSALFPLCVCFWDIGNCLKEALLQTFAKVSEGSLIPGQV